LPRPASPALNFALWTALAGFALAAFSPAILNDGDTYWHIRAGEWMLDHRAVLHSDVFFYSVAGRPWDAAEWLAEVIMALAWRAHFLWIGGWASVHLLFGIAAALTAGIVAGALRGRIALAPAFLAMRPSPRPTETCSPPRSRAAMCAGRSSPPMRRW
jgi:hypothetical protein